MNQNIVIRGARVHNLKNISLTIPKNQLVVFTGVSGSGKSSLAFDTIYAEGQRRYVESLSSYARQFLGVMDKPDVDAIEGLSPAISIDQKTTSHNPRSTVGTITEIYDYLRLLFARVGHIFCPSCGRKVERQSVEQIVKRALEDISSNLNNKQKRQERVMILSPIVRDRKGEFSKMFDNLKAKGFNQVRIDGNIHSLNEEFVLIKTNKHTIDAVIDRITVSKKDFKDQKNTLKRRLSEAIEQAVSLSQGLVIVGKVADASFSFPDKPQKVTDTLYSEKFACPFCNLSFPEIEPRIFSFNSPHGACPTCHGIGSLLKVDPELVVKTNLSLSEGAIVPFANLIYNDTWFSRLLTTVCREIGIDIRKPLKLNSADKLNKLLYGTGSQIYEVAGENRQGRMTAIHESFPGIINELERRYLETQSEYVRNEIGKYLRNEICPACTGKRLKKEALAITVNGKNIAAVCSYSIKNIFNWIKELNQNFNEREKTIANLIIKELINRLSFLLSVGLDYLSLDRSASSLAGGEAQRIRLASQIGSGLSGVLYVLDEPSVGLHQRDNLRLINTLKKLRDIGNTVIMVEHDKEMMENADTIFDFGPKAGHEGGKIIASGKTSEIIKNSNSLTGAYLSGRKKIVRDKLRLELNSSQHFNIFGCSENNLKNIDIDIPLNKLVCVSGVSGSGKSTLVVDTIYHALASHLNPLHREKGGKFRDLNGLNQVKRVILIDQSPIGRTPRSNPATYTQAFTFIRELYAQTADAKVRGYRQGRFSFNVKGGRCEVCQGEGQTKIEMQFLPDVYVTCDVCQGSRYNSETLEVRFKDKNIAEVLKMTVAEAYQFFNHIPPITQKLETLYQVGLSYIHLGQPAPHLSGGEAQRVKLASELSKKGSRQTVYILDEPTTGLHFADLQKLLDVLHALVDIGNTVIVIEHNMDIIKNADYLIDLGPEGGDDGGQIIAAGTPEYVAGNANSYTGQFLKKILGN